MEGHVGAAEAARMAMATEAAAPRRLLQPVGRPPAAIQGRPTAGDGGAHLARRLQQAVARHLASMTSFSVRKAPLPRQP